jgi:putative restriction endonuclease
MSPLQNQVYEKYWSVTLAYTNIHGRGFNSTLKAILDFIDSNDVTSYNAQMYKRLQDAVGRINGLKSASVRKSINQFVKLGFIEHKIQSYHKECKSFLAAKTNRKRKTIFSKIVYENSSFNRDITIDSKEKEINFLLKTLEEVGKLTKEDILALMTQEISSYTKGFLTQEELSEASRNADEIEFYERKYNQLNHFKTILSNLDELVFINDELYFEEDAKVIFGSDLKKTMKIRDNYLHLLYKNQLKEETEEKEGKIKCMVELLDYPSLVASHIKPFIETEEEEAYDPENGLLLSRNMDILFDQGYISFTEQGKIIISSELSDDLKRFLSGYGLNSKYLTDKRKSYLKYHTENVFKSEL